MLLTTSLHHSTIHTGGGLLNAQPLNIPSALRLSVSALQCRIPSNFNVGKVFYYKGETYQTWNGMPFYEVTVRIWWFDIPIPNMMVCTTILLSLLWLVITIRVWHTKHNGITLTLSQLGFDIPIINVFKCYMSLLFGFDISNRKWYALSYMRSRLGFDDLTYQPWYDMII